jgi:hypothetical protein
MNKYARTKLADKNIHWKEAYTPATKRFKKMYGDIIGNGSYFRWEGTDRDTNDEYFVVVGPAKMKTPSAKWFAGSRKLPSEWAAGGEYFATINDAIDYAKEKWGVPSPSSHKNYTAKDLKGIGKKMDTWREQHESETKSSNCHTLIKTDINIDDFDMIVHEAMGGERWVQREGYYWWDVDNISSDPDFARKVEETPYLSAAQGALFKEDMKRRKEIAKTYGEEYRNADFYKVWIAHKDDQGTYLVAVGPYMAHKYNKEAEAKDKFGFYHKKLNIAVDDEVTRRVQDLIAEYEKQYGTILDDEDVKVFGLDTADPYVGLSDQGRDKVKNSEAYQGRLKLYNAKNPGQAIKEYKKRKKQYDQAIQDGTALLHDIPRPPRVDLFRLPIGQKGFTAITKSKPGVGTQDVSTPEGVGEVPATAAEDERYGFDSMHEAIAYGAAAIPKGGFPIPDPSTVPNTTNEDLRRARMAKMEQEREDITEDAPPPGRVAPETTMTEPTTIDQEKTPTTITPEHIEHERALDAMELDTAIGEDVDDEGDLYDMYLRKQKQKAMSKTILNLVKLAQTFDDEGRDDAAEAIHKILRKHVEL